MGRISRDQMFMEMAGVVAQRGTCPRAKVGSVIADEGGKVRSLGYNGSEPKKPHCEDIGCDIKNGHCVRTTHAETNAIEGLLFGFDKPLTLYVTHCPCMSCAIDILFYTNHTRHCYDKPGIVKVVYGRNYRDNESKAREILAKGGIVIEQYKEDEGI